MTDISPVTDIGEVLGALELAPDSDGRFRAHNIDGPGAVVFGGQILAQSIVAAARSLPDKGVRSIQTIFARGASVDADLELVVDVMHAGRAMGSATVTASQGDRLCARSMLLLSADEPDLIRHQPAAPTVAGPDDSPPGGHDNGWWETRIVDGVDIDATGPNGPAELAVWSRVAGDLPDDQAVHQALLAYATEGFLIATSMRPHDGVGQSMAHRTVSTSVLTHAVTFHEPLDAGAWTLLAMESPYAGRGRSFGRAQVFDVAGRHVASFQQENMVRAMPDHGASSSGPSKY